MQANSGNAALVVDKASSAVHSAIDEAARKARVPLDRMAEMAHAASDKAADAGTQATHWLSKRGEQLSAGPRKLIDDTSSYVSANPLKSLGIAVVAALVVGRLMR